MTTRVRLARPGGEHFEAGFAKTARAALDGALADGAIALSITYEIPNGETRVVAVPDAMSVKRGLTYGAESVLWPPSDGRDDD